MQEAADSDQHGRAPSLAKPRQAYDNVAKEYDDWRWSRFWRIHEAPHVVPWLNSRLPGVGLDAGGGTGAYAKAYCGRVRVLAALDISFEMLRRYQIQLAGAAGHPSLCPIQGDVKAMPFMPASFDWLLCCRVLSHVAQLDAVMHEFARVLRPGAECLVTDVHPDHPYSHVSIPSATGQVNVETYKHSIDRLLAAAAIYGLKMVGLDELRLSDFVPPPSPEEFAKLHRNPNLAVFYACRLQRL